VHSDRKSVCQLESGSSVSFSLVFICVGCRLTRRDCFSETIADCPLDRLLEQLSKLLPLRGVLVAATDTLMTHFEANNAQVRGNFV
jgi:hypothetical protein